MIVADKDGNKVTKDYHAGVPFANQGGFHVKGSNSLDWGMKRRFGNILGSKSGNMAMFAFDHGCFMGSTVDLERLDLLTLELLPYVDALMDTRGALRTCAPPECRKAITLRTTSDSSMLNDDLSHEVIAVDIEDCIRMNADYMVVQTFAGADGQPSSLDNLSRTISADLRYGIPTMGVVVVDKQMEWTDRFFKLAARPLVELGANIIKTYYCESFEKIVSVCPVPIVVTGGKKLSEDEVLMLAYRPISEGAYSLDMGRNIFQNENPAAMAGAVGEIVHHGFIDKQAFEFYQDTTHQQNSIFSSSPDPAAGKTRRSRMPLSCSG